MREKKAMRECERARLRERLNMANMGYINVQIDQRSLTGNTGVLKKGKYSKIQITEVLFESIVLLVSPVKDQRFLEIYFKT